MFSWIYRNSLFFEAFEARKQQRLFMKGREHAGEERAALIRCDSAADRLKVAEEFRKEISLHSLDSEFHAGYGVRWTEYGDADAIDGVCYAKMFRNGFYNQGWTGRVSAMILRGWRNERFEELLKEMESK